jgi:anti-sigma-K factor RskA
MSTHIADDLPLLLIGEASQAEAIAAAAHLRACDDCRDELVSALIAHAALMSARRNSPELFTSAAPTELPDLDVVAVVRSGASARRRRIAAVAVAASVLAGGTATYLATRSTTPPSGRTVALAAYDAGQVGASARLVHGNHMSVTATSLPHLDASHRYEVWLTNSARTAMQPVGWIGENGRASIDVPRSLLASYTDIEVSVQQVDAPYSYSGTSVLRGAYG